MIWNLVLEMVDNASGVVEEVRNLVLELVGEAEKEGGFQVLLREIRQRGLEQRILDTEGLRNSRLRKKELLEKAWKSKTTAKRTPGRLEEVCMEWEDIEIDSWMEWLGLEEDDKVEVMEVV